MDMRIPPLEIEILLESNPVKIQNISTSKEIGRSCLFAHRSLSVGVVSAQNGRGQMSDVVPPLEPAVATRMREDAFQRLRMALRQNEWTWHQT